MAALVAGDVDVLVECSPVGRVLTQGGDGEQLDRAKQGE